MQDRHYRPAPAKRQTTSSLVKLGAAAGVLAAAALFNGARTRAAIRANPPSGKFVTVDGVEVHYVEHGAPDAPPVVLIHGNGSMVQDFIISGVVASLAERHRVIVFDRPGSGYTERPRGREWGPEAQANLLVAAAAAIGVERPTVVGHSWGTLVALHWALDHADQVAALVLASGYYYPTPRLDVVTVLPAVTPVIGDVMRHTVSPIVGRLTLPLGNRLVFSPAPTTEPWKDEFPAEMALRPSQIRATLADTAMMVPAAALLGPRYSELKLPTVIISGDGDKLVSCDFQSKRLAGELPHARLIVVAGAGHMIQHIAPDAFVDAVELAAGSAA